MENNLILTEELLELIEKKRFSAIKTKLIGMNSADIAVLFEELDRENLPKIFRLLPKELAAETFVEMDSDLQEL